MKKMSRVILLGTIMFTLGACKNNKTTTESVLAESITNESSISEVAESSSIVEEVESGPIFVGSLGTYEFISFEQVTSHVGDLQSMAILMNYTNTSDTQQNPREAFITDMVGEQETDTTVETLETVTSSDGRIPLDYSNREAVDMAEKNIKPGATVEVVVAVQLIYPGNPLYLRDLNTTEIDNGSKYEKIIETTIKEAPVQEENSLISLENYNALESYNALEIEYARILLMTDAIDPNSSVVYVAHTPAGTPISSYSSGSEEYPNDVTILFGEYSASGSITYSSNGDGTITIYPVPSHWHQSDQSPEGYRALTQEILDTAQTVYVDPGDDTNVINKIESVDFMYQ